MKKMCKWDKWNPHIKEYNCMRPLRKGCLHPHNIGKKCLKTPCTIITKRKPDFVEVKAWAWWDDGIEVSYANDKWCYKKDCVPVTIRIRRKDYEKIKGK